MKKLNRFLACLTAAVMFFTVIAPTVFSASAAADDCENCPTIVVPGVFQSDVRYYDENGNEKLNSDGEKYSKPFFMESSKDVTADALKNALLPIAKLLITQHDKDHKSAKAIADVLGRVVFENIKLDEYGQPVKDIRATEYNTSLANLSEEDRNYALDQIPLNEYVEKVGLDHLYFFSYVSTGSIKATAERLFDLIQTAKKETGHDKVNLLPISQGGSIFNALMQLYRDKGLEFSADVNRVCLIVPASDGAAVLGDIYRYGLLDDDDALYGYMFPSLLDEDQQALAYLINLILRIMPNADVNAILDEAVDTIIEDYLENSSCLWALVPSGDYPACRDKYLADDDSVHIVKETDWYYNAQLNHRKYIAEERANGVEFFDIVDYNYTLYKICDSWNKVNADGIIHTDSESLGAVSVAVDTPLPDGYAQANTYCTDPTHNHIDSDRLIDASAGVLCETTFYFKGQDHETTARNNVLIKLATVILTDPSMKNVYSNPAFPQFNYARDSRDLIKDIALWKNSDTSSLGKENSQKLSDIISKAEDAVNNTCMTTEDFNNVKDEFYAVIYEIQNGTAKTEEKPSAILDFITKFLKRFSDLLLKIFGGSGWSDIILFRNINCGGN